MKHTKITMYAKSVLEGGVIIITNISWAVNAMENYAPTSLALEWDNVGLLVGDENARINKILLALDLTDDVLDEAANLGAGLIITHHPPIFKPLKRINACDPLGRRIIKLISSGMAVYSAHTNLDITEGGTCDILFDLLGLADKEYLDTPSKVGRAGILPEKTSLNKLALLCKKALNMKNTSFIGDPSTVIKKIGLCTGSGMEYIAQAKDKLCQAYLTGDIKYHEAQAALDMELCLVDVSHYASEVIILKPLALYLKAEAESSGVEIDIAVSRVNGQVFTYI